MTKNLVRQSEETTLRLNEELKYVRDQTEKRSIIRECHSSLLQIRQVFQETCDELQQTQKMLEDSKQVSERALISHHSIFSPRLVSC